MSSGSGGPFERFQSGTALAVGVLVAVVLFLFAVRLLGTATAAAVPLVQRAFFEIVVGDASALGLGWLGAYVLANGSVIAALALSLFTADLLSAQQLFLMVAGSRLGAAAVVVFVGALDYAQKRSYSLRKAVSMGVLTFLITHSIYLPVTVLGYVGLSSLQGPFETLSHDWAFGGRTVELLGSFATGVTAHLGPLPSFLLAILVLFGSLSLFDRLLASVDTTTLRRRVFSHFRRTWLSFGIGLAVTGVTTSVAFSLGVIVPLYNRGYVRRDELVPYVLGANLGTLFDTLLVAVVLESTAGTAVVLELLVVATLVTLAMLAVHDRYSRLVVRTHDRLVDDRRLFVLFVVSLLVAPLLLLVVPLALRLVTTIP
jgi:sodium-dependent phosphate cotransporter